MNAPKVMAHLPQLLMASFGMVAVWIALGPTDHPWRPLAPLIGLCGQPAWAWFAWRLHRRGQDVWGLVIIVVAWTVVYARGVLLQWGAW